MSGCRVVGWSDVGLLWKWVSAASGEALDQAGHKSPTQAPQPPRPRQRKYIRGELNTSTAFGALRERGINASVGGVPETEHGLQPGERKKERIVCVGPGLRECEAGYETKNC